MPSNNHYNRKSFLCNSIGTTFDAKYWYTWEISGICGISISFFIHIYALYILRDQVLLWSSNYNGSIITPTCSFIFFYAFYLPIAVLAIISLLQATFTNPGAVPMGARPFVKVRRILNHRTSSTTELIPQQPQSSSVSNFSEGEEVESNQMKDITMTHSSTEVKRTPTSTTTTTPTTTVTNNEIDMNTIRRCYKCNDNYKPPRAHHDSISGRCIIKFDHYCPWVNNAIGILNHKFFCLFLFYTTLSCIVSLLLLFTHYIHCIPYNNYRNSDTSETTTMNDSMTSSTRNSAINGQHSEILLDPDGHRRLYNLLLVLRRTLLAENDDDNNNNKMINTFTPTDIDDLVCYNFFQRYTIIALLIISIIFFIFTIIMILEQIDTIQTGKGKIARMKQRIGATGSTEYETVTEEFNEMFGGTSPNIAWHWFIPIHVRYPKKMKQVVLGYEYNLTICNPCYPYGMEPPSSSSSSTTTVSEVLNGCNNNNDESIPLSRSSSTMNQNINDNDTQMSNIDLESNINISTTSRDGLMKTTGTTKTLTTSTKKKSPPIPTRSDNGIFRRELSTTTSCDSNNNTLNRRTNRSNTAPSDFDHGTTTTTQPEGGITLVERSRTRIT